MFEQWGLSKGDRVVVAMSGGVDSSVTAALMVEAGFDVVGMTLQLYDHGLAVEKKGACCAGIDIYDAKEVARQLGFPHYVLDYEQVFRKAVIEDFADSYSKGETPIPCVRCNQRVKFRDMLDTARDLGAKALVTGHYAQRIMGTQGVELHRGTDARRDQSYFLFATTREQLDFIRFPLGDMHDKQATRAIADRLNLRVAKKPDSQDICFVPSGHYSRIVEKLRPGTLEAGKIVDQAGRVLGTHEGIINYTIGQRKGIGVSGPEPLYVIALRPTTHEVVVGPREALAKHTIHLKDVNWLSDHTADVLTCEVKIRSTQGSSTATLRPQPGGRAIVALDAPEYGVSGGQACVFYQGSQVLGGGWIMA